MAAQYLFVYGTLREEVAHPMGSTLKQHARRTGRATFRGRLFDLGEYPAMVASASPSDRVVGELYRIEPGHEAALLAELDRYEDFDPDQPSAGEYVRVRATIEPESGDALEAWIYQYNHSTRELSRIVSGDYCAHLRATRNKE